VLGAPAREETRDPAEDQRGGEKYDRLEKRPGRVFRIENQAQEVFEIVHPGF
jgi:hypothetical protein